MKGKEKLLSNYLETIRKTILQTDFAENNHLRSKQIQGAQYESTIFFQFSIDSITDWISSFKTIYKQFKNPDLICNLQRNLINTARVHFPRIFEKCCLFMSSCLLQPSRSFSAEQCRKTLEDFDPLLLKPRAAKQQQITAIYLL